MKENLLETIPIQPGICRKPHLLNHMPLIIMPNVNRMVYSKLIFLTWFISLLLIRNK